MTIRLASPTDVPAIIDFQLKLASETEDLKLDINTLASGTQHLVKDPNKGKYYLAESEGQVIGCLMTTTEWSEWRDGTILWIQSVYIDEAHRGKGVFKSLYEHVRKIVATDHHMKGIRLYVDKKNTAAQKTYEKLGMNGEHYQVYEWIKP